VRAGVDLVSSLLGLPLRPGFTKGFVYSDAQVDDARLVVLAALDAAERGARILPRTRLVSARRHAQHWEASLEPADGGAVKSIRARALVNAAGPWVARLLCESLGVVPWRELRMAKGSHIVVRKLYDHDHAYALQSSDKRVIFTIPYERDYTLIGTTDVEFAGDPGCPEISPSETAYLCERINGYFARGIVPSDVVWSYSGVRPLLEDDAADLSAVTRDYLLEYDANPQQAALLTVYGGKITTYRRLAEEALALLAPALGGTRPSWTATASLPGGDIPDADFTRFLGEFQRQFSWLPDRFSQRYAQVYGTRAYRLLGEAHALSDLGKELGDGVFEVEVDYLVGHEWARTPQDVLWRRSKLGLHVTAETARQLAAAMPPIVDRRLESKISLRG
jgi:glycerol-3-phosphate dehydrogenase